MHVVGRVNHYHLKYDEGLTYLLSFRVIYNIPFMFVNVFSIPPDKKAIFQNLISWKQKLYLQTNFFKIMQI